MPDTLSTTGFVVPWYFDNFQSYIKDTVTSTLIDGQDMVLRLLSQNETELFNEYSTLYILYVRNDNPFLHNFRTCVMIKISGIKAEQDHSTSTPGDE
jgi:hypothetical protein